LQEKLQRKGIMSLPQRGLSAAPKQQQPPLAGARNRSTTYLNHCAQNQQKCF
jgi:hypothetical protein